MDTLISKLLTVEVSFLSKLPNKDQVFCLEVMDSYKNSYDQLSFYKVEFEDRLNKGETKGIQSNSSYYFSFDGALQIIRKNAIQTKHNHFRQLANYFIKAYSFDKDFFKTFEESLTKDDCFLPLDLEKILKFIFSKAPGLLQAAVNNVKKSLHNRIWKREKVSVKNLKLSIADFVSFDSYTWDGKRLNSHYDHDKAIINLIKAFCYYDTGNFEDTKKYFDVLPHEEYQYSKVDLDIIYTVPSSNISSIKFFKNRRLDVTFKTADHCQKFVQMFELNNIQER